VVERVAVLGLGYVGCVTAACLAKEGHSIVGVDIHPAKVEAVNAGKAPLSEPGLSALIRAQVDEGRLRATVDPLAAVRETDIAVVCVGTPTGPDEAPNLQALSNACRQVGSVLREKPGDRPYTLIVRSTVPPGTAEELVIPALQQASGKSGPDAALVLTIPEFLREASALKDYDDPSLFVVGASTPPPDPARQVISSLFGRFEDRIQWVSYRSAELLKNVCNAYHALKVVFANEVGTLCQAVGIDGIELMRTFCLDTKLNCSAAYLRPGLPFGGSCLPKDLRALLHLGRSLGVEVPQLRATLRSNELQIGRTIEAIEALGRRRIGLEGLAFKPGTDDVRESPMVAIAERLLGRGYDLRIYDPLVYASSLRERIEFTHLTRRLVRGADAFLRHSEVLLRSRSAPTLLDRARALGLEPRVVDLGRPPYRVVQEEPASGIYTRSGVALSQARWQ
jgi:GDP-mannose 6-dehydrogenase